MGETEYILVEISYFEKSGKSPLKTVVFLRTIFFMNNLKNSFSVGYSYLKIHPDTN
ncbi:Uncharacterized protein dnl_05220 [Desulfonema limicola]|uniref:Uncharacterized protein n=1 Tax=Desulfonema limicola TaxID=45656 RepID=A0A975B3V9_9BACT|nr:Uncharacterized protein dnl_05220 [Desulfonema limicola]